MGADARISWRRLEERAARACERLAEAGVPEGLIGEVRELLLSAVQRQRPYVPHRNPPRVLRAKILDTMERRLEEAEEFYFCDLDQWAALCHKLLPERYADPAAPAEPAPQGAAPGTLAKLDLMAARGAAGEALFHPRDPAGLPDGLGMLAGEPELIGQTNREGAGRACRDLGEGGDTRLVTLQGEGREETPDSGRTPGTARPPRVLRDPSMSWGGPEGV